MPRKIGGYRLIDLENKAITTGGDAVNIPGIYEKVESCPVRTVLTGLVIDGVEMREVCVDFKLVGTDYVATFGGTTVTVDDDDDITVTSGTGLFTHNIIITSSAIKVRTIIVNHDAAEINTVDKLKDYIGTDGVLLATGSVLASSVANPALQINNGGTGGATQVGYIPAGGSVTYAAVGSATVQDTIFPA